jgi:hypothetical protein
MYVCAYCVTSPFPYLSHEVGIDRQFKTLQRGLHGVICSEEHPQNVSILSSGLS